MSLAVIKSYTKDMGLALSILLNNIREIHVNKIVVESTCRILLNFGKYTPGLASSVEHKQKHNLIDDETCPSKSRPLSSALILKIITRKVNVILTGRNLNMRQSIFIT